MEIGINFDQVCSWTKVSGKVCDQYVFIPKSGKWEAKGSPIANGMYDTVSEVLDDDYGIYFNISTFYFKPSIRLQMSNRKMIEVFFKCNEELEEFETRHLGKFKIIKIN